MLHYEKNVFSEGIDVNKTSDSIEFDICHHCYILDNWFKIQPDVSNRCQDVLMITMNLINITILNIMVLIIAVLIMELANLLRKIYLNKKNV